MASICHFSLFSDGPISTINNLLLCSTAMAVAVMPSPIILLSSLFPSISCPSLHSKTFLSMWTLSSVMTQLKNYIPFRESLLWYTHSGKRSHCHYVTFCLKHVWYAFWILIKFLIYIIHFSLPKAGFLTGLLGKQKYNLRKHHSSLSL